MRVFQPQQIFLCREAAGKTGRASIGADHTVAGDYDGKGVSTTGGADGADCVLSVDLLGYGSVTARFPEGNGGQGLSDFDVKRCAGKIQRDIEYLAAPREIVAELPFRLFQHRMLLIFA
jgi:hypothetical protein